VVVSLFASRERDDLDRGLERGYEVALQNAFHISADGFDSNLVDMPLYARVYHQATGRIVLHGVGPVTLPRGPAGFSDQDVAGQRWRVYVASSRMGNQRWGGTPDIQVAQPTATADDRIATARNIVAGVASLGALLVGIPTWVLAGSALSPLPRLRARARDISDAADLSVRLPEAGPPEVAELAVTLNRMLDRLQHSVGQADAALKATRTFTADAGHELRTPLTSLRANLDVLSRDGLSEADHERSLAEALSAHGRVTALIEALQVLARGDAAAGDRSGRVDLAELGDTAVVEARRRHPGVAFTFEASPEACVRGDADGLRRLIDNLLENGARHGGSSVRVAVREGDGYVLLSVDDDGPGIPDAEKRRVFDRFARGSAARNGTGSGLGLAIAAQQAELHGGRLKLEDSPLGGASFALTLPA
jgi:signal transduction histidine kinase